MVDWTSEAVINLSNEIFHAVSHVGIGAYMWECFSRLDFEWSLITRKRTFKWPMALFLYCKWTLVAAFTGMLIALNIKTKIDCQALYTFNQFMGHSSIGSSSTLLMLRSVAIWNRNKFVAFPFMLIAAGLWAILFHGVTTVKASYDPTTNACNVNSVTNDYLTPIYLYTMFTDLTVLLVTLAGLSWSPGKSGLWRMLWDQGIVFFLVAFLANLVPAVVLLMDLNPVLNIMFSIPAIAATSTCACRCFVTLSEYARRGDDSTGILASQNNNGWTHRLQGPMSDPEGRGIVKQPATIQFTREVQQIPGPTDTIDGLIRTIPGEDADIRLSTFSPIKYDDRASDDTLSLPQLRRNDDRFKGDNAV